MSLIHFIDNNSTGIALIDDFESITFEKLYSSVKSLAHWIKNQNINSLAIELDNSIQWILFDLAAQEAGICFVPIPTYFSNRQKKSILKDLNIDAVITATCYSLCNGLETEIISCPPLGDFVREDITIFRLFKTKNQIYLTNVPKDTSKIIFSEGPTDSPKGICLTIADQLDVAASVLKRVDIESPTHMCLFPLTTPLENIAGVYALILAGGVVKLFSEERLGLSRGVISNLLIFLELIDKEQPHTLITVPKMIEAMKRVKKSGWLAPTALKFITVDDDNVSINITEEARLYQLPMYKEYHEIGGYDGYSS